MKTKLIFGVLAILPLVLLFGCVPSVETITKKPGEYVYGMGEKIQIVDIETDEQIATLTVDGSEVLRNEPFTIQRLVGTKEDGEKVYEDVAYQQLVEIYYAFANEPNYSKSISRRNFSLIGAEGTINPDIDYTSRPREGCHSFVVALKERNSSLDFGFTYDVFQMRYTAKIQVTVSKTATEVASKPVSKTASKPASKEPSAQPAPPSSVAAMPAEPVSVTPSPQSTASVGDLAGYRIFIIIIALMTAVIVALCIVIVVLSNKKIK